MTKSSPPALYTDAQPPPSQVVLDRGWAGVGQRASARPKTVKQRRPKPGQRGAQGALARVYVVSYDLEYRAELSRVMRRLTAHCPPTYDPRYVPNPFYPLVERPEVKLSVRHLPELGQRIVWELQRPIVGLPVVAGLISAVVGLLIF